MNKISIALQTARCISVYLLAGKVAHFSCLPVSFFPKSIQRIHLSPHLLTPLIITSFFRLVFNFPLYTEA